MSAFGKIWGVLTTQERRSAIPLAILIFVGMLLETIGLGLVLPAIALLMRQDIAQAFPLLRPVLRFFGNPGQRELIFGGMAALVVFYLLKACFLAYLFWRQNHFLYTVQAELSHRLFTIYLRQPYAFHLQHNSAQLMRNIVTEVGQFAAYAITPVLSLVTDGLVLLGIAILLLTVEPVTTPVVVLILSVLALTFYRVTRTRVGRWGLERQHHQGLRAQHLQQGLGGAKDVKLLGRETDFIGQFRLHAAADNRIGERVATLQQLPRLWLELLAVSGLAALVVTILLRGSELSSIIPTLGLFAVAAFRLIPGINRILAGIQGIRFARPAIDLLYDEVRRPAPELPRKRRGNPDFGSDIRLVNVTYTYPEAAAPSLQDVSLSIKKGEFVGFIGSSGSGKSTLVDIIMGLLTSDAGSVLVDGKEIGMDMRGWQDQIGYVQQVIYLTDDTLRRNVAFGLGEDQIDDAAVERAIRAAQLTEFVQSLPAKLETVVGERGVRLSGGQRQRIGIARALYHDPPVLVLDEATSALDTATETGVMQAVTALHATKTILVVAHRVSTVEHCERLYRLEHGRIVETR